jgi:hypothetical protein
MFELISVLMCGGGGGYQPPPYVPPPKPKPAPPPPAAVKQPQTAVRQKQKRSVRGAETPSMAGGFGGTLLTGTQGIGDQSLITGKSMLGG